MFVWLINQNKVGIFGSSLGAYISIYIYIYRQIDIDRQMDRQTDRQIGRYRYPCIYLSIYLSIYISIYLYIYIICIHIYTHIMCICWNCHNKAFSFQCRFIMAEGGLRKDYHIGRKWKLVLLIQINCVFDIYIVINGHSVGIQIYGIMKSNF